MGPLSCTHLPTVVKQDQPGGLGGLEADSRSVFLVDTMLERQRQIGVLNQQDKTNGLFHLV